jgi:hypothetical protein
MQLHRTQQFAEYRQLSGRGPSGRVNCISNRILAVKLIYSITEHLLITRSGKRRTVCPHRSIGLAPTDTGRFEFTVGNRRRSDWPRFPDIFRDSSTGCPDGSKAPSSRLLPGKKPAILQPECASAIPMPTVFLTAARRLRSKRSETSPR